MSSRGIAINLHELQLRVTSRVYLCVDVAPLVEKTQSSVLMVELSDFLFATDCIVLCCVVLCCVVLYCVVMYCIVLYCIVLYCIA